MQAEAELSGLWPDEAALGSALLSAKGRRFASAVRLQARARRYGLLWAFYGGGSPVSKGALGWPLGADAARLLRTERLPRILCSAPKKPPELSALWPDVAALGSAPL